MFDRVLTAVNWIVLGVFGFAAVIFLFGNPDLNEGNSTLATLMVVIALTGPVWVPPAFVFSVLSIMRTYCQKRTLRPLIKIPALYVCIIITVLLLLMFA